MLLPILERTNNLISESISCWVKGVVSAMFGEHLQANRNFQLADWNGTVLLKNVVFVLLGKPIACANWCGAFGPLTDGFAPIE